LPPRSGAFLTRAAVRGNQSPAELPDRPLCANRVVNGCPLGGAIVIVTSAFAFDQIVR
jgi:hypothetical protein